LRLCYTLRQTHIHGIREPTCSTWKVQGGLDSLGLILQLTGTKTTCPNQTTPLLHFKLSSKTGQSILLMIYTSQVKVMLVFMCLIYLGESINGIKRQVSSQTCKNTT
jgi:hypothetical protein